MFAPAASAASASRQMRATAASSPRGPSATGQVMSIVCAWKTSDSIWRRRSSSSSSRIGFGITSWRACSGVSSSRFRSEPTLAATLITTASRIESIGGFVTCAKSCLKYAYRSGCRWERTASGRSFPMEPIASSALRASGARMTFMSSCV